MALHNMPQGIFRVQLQNYCKIMMAPDATGGFRSLLKCSVASFRERKKPHEFCTGTQRLRQVYISLKIFVHALHVAGPVLDYL